MAEIRFTTGTFTSQDEEIYFQVNGDGPDTVVLCHGLGGNHAIWFQQIPRLAERFRVVTWDQRGFGRSTDRAGASGPAAAVADLGALLNHVGIPEAHLVGQSMGGWAVLGYALAARERVLSIVMADTTGGLVTDEIIGALTAKPRRDVAPDIVGVHPAIGPYLDVTKGFLYQQIGGFRGGVDDAEMIARILATRHDVETVRALRKPALCLVGADDDLIPPAAVREVAKVLDARFVEIADAGHSPYFERPDAWNTVVLEFLTSLT